LLDGDRGFEIFFEFSHYHTIGQDYRSARRVARGAIAPPIPKVSPKFFWLLEHLIYRPKKYFSANKRNF